ncbi:MAG: phosphoglycolate phosphatase [Pseudomonadota bacterium]
MTKEEAEALALKIEAYWREHGCHVVVVAERMEYDPQLRAVRYELRSNLINGLPTASAHLARVA